MEDMNVIFTKLKFLMSYMKPSGTSLSTTCVLEGKKYSEFQGAFIHRDNKLFNEK